MPTAFVPVSEKEKQAFLTQNIRSFIPGYTGHCPTLKFHYGKCYGADTKEIMQELREKGMLRSIKTGKYRQEDLDSTVLKPIERQKGQMEDYALKYTTNRASKCIIGYTGFIPTFNFRYGKSYGRTADDCMTEFNIKQRHLDELEEEKLRMYRAKSLPKMTPLRGSEEVDRFIKDVEVKHLPKPREITPEDPPISGYTGHIPKMRSSEESLAQRYSTVVKRGLTLLKEERDRRQKMRKVQNKIQSIVNEVESKYAA